MSGTGAPATTPSRRRRRVPAWPAALGAAFLAACAGDTAPVAGGPLAISDGRGAAFEVSLARLPEAADGFVAVWHGTRDGNAEIYARRLDAEGHPVGSSWRLTDDPAASYEPDLAPVVDPSGETSYVVGWYDRASDDRLTARLGRWSDAGVPAWMVPLPGGARPTRNPVVIVRRDRIFAAWLADLPVRTLADGTQEDLADQRSEIWMGSWSLDGAVLSPPHKLADASRTTWNLNAAVGPDDGVWVVFDARVDTRASELYRVRTAPHAPPVVERLTADDGYASTYPDLAFGDDRRAALTWFDERDGNQEVYLWAGPAGALDAVAGGGPDGDLLARSRRVTDTPGRSFGAYLTWSGDRVGLAWCDDTLGQSELYLQTFDEGGAPLDPPRRLTDTPTESSIPSIAPAGDGFALAWNEYVRTAEGHDVRQSTAVFRLAR